MVDLAVVVGRLAEPKLPRPNARPHVADRPGMADRRRDRARRFQGGTNTATRPDRAFADDDRGGGRVRSSPDRAPVDRRGVPRRARPPPRPTRQALTENVKRSGRRTAIESRPRAVAEPAGRADHDSSGDVGGVPGDPPGLGRARRRTADRRSAPLRRRIRSHDSSRADRGPRGGLPATGADRPAAGRREGGGSGDSGRRPPCQALEGS